MGIMEEWKDLPKYSGYQVSTFGQVRSLDKIVNSRNYSKRLVKGKVLKQQLNIDTGYLVAAFFIDGKLKYADVHRLVALAFVPNPDNKPQANHKDGNKLNNRVDNLEWNTPKENMQHAIETGLRSDKGEASVNAILNNEIVLNIRKLYATGNYTYKEIGEQFKIHRDYIGLIVNKKRWAHI